MSIKDFYSDLAYERGSSDSKVANFYKMVSAIFFVCPVLVVVLTIFVIVYIAKVGFGFPCFLGIFATIFMIVMMLVLYNKLKD